MITTKGFDEGEAETLASMFQYHTFKAKDVLVYQGQQWPFIMIVLGGSVKDDDRSHGVVGRGGQLGALEYFGRWLPY